jgi:NADPH2:quinone reductase
MLPTNLVMMKGLDVLGCPTVIATVNDPSLRAPRLAAVLAWARSGAIRPHVGRTYPLASFKEAMRAKWNGEFVGGCALNA